MDVQSQVLGRGRLAEVRNPSGARIRRVRDAKKLGRVSPVEQVIAEEGVDESAANSLRELDPSMPRHWSPLAEHFSCATPPRQSGQLVSEACYLLTRIC